MKITNPFFISLRQRWWMGSALAFGGCERATSVLAPVTPEAAGIAKIWWVFFAICTAVYVVVVLVAVRAALRHRLEPQPTPPAPVPIESAREARIHRVIAWAVGGTAVILIGLLVADLWTQRSLGARHDDPLVIRVTGQQWWWAIEYQNPDVRKVFETANEFHVPVGRSIRLLLESNDVIHSFWIPRLHGKRDLVPGHPTALSFKIDRAGRYEGVCAEFCGFQHAHMGIAIVAEDPARYEAWAETQRALAPEPTTDRQRHGRELFERGTCASCHTINGTSAHSRVGPLLTHVGGQPTIGAGVAPNTREHLTAWIAHPDQLKPGVKMPPNALPPADLEALVDYLESLK